MDDDLKPAREFLKRTDASAPTGFPTLERKVIGYVPLDVPQKSGGEGLWSTVSSRRSVRSYPTREMTQGDVSQILFSSQGVTGRHAGHALRAAPSAGARYPLDTFVVVNRVKEMEPGQYRYDPSTHSLETLVRGSMGEKFAAAALGQRMCADASCLLIWTAVFERVCSRYGARGYRYVFLDAGHAAHAVALTATASGLGSCQIAAFFDDAVNALVGADGDNETAIYMTSVG